MSQQLILAFLNLPLRHLLFGLLALLVLYLIANRTAYCLLRSRNIPRSSAGTISGILSAALFIIYLFLGIVIYFAVFAPNRAEVVRALLPPPSDMLPPGRPPAPVPPQTDAPQGMMAAEQDWRERRRHLAATTEQLIKAMLERQQLFAQEQRYVISEGISGTEDYYLPPSEEPESVSEDTTIAVDKPISFAEEISAYFNQQPEPKESEQPSAKKTTISVDKPVSFAEEISAYFNKETPPQKNEHPSYPAPVPSPAVSIFKENRKKNSGAVIPDQEPSEKLETPPRVNATIPLTEQKEVMREPEKPPVVLEPSEKVVPQDAAVAQPSPPRVSATIPLPLTAQKEMIREPKKLPVVQKPDLRPLQKLAPMKEVSCKEIRMYLDAADLQIFERAMRQEEGKPTAWRGPGGSYTVIPGPIKGRCREYSMRASIQSRSLRCHASCINTTSIDQAIESAAEALHQQDDDEVIILRSMNRGDLDALNKALTYYGPISWRSMSGIFYTVSPMRLGNPCREYKVKANIRGKIYEYIASKCK